MTQYLRRTLEFQTLKKHLYGCFFGIIHVWFRKEIIHKLTLRKKVLIIPLSMVVESRIMGVHTLGENQRGEPEK